MLNRKFVEYCFSLLCDTEITSVGNLPKCLLFLILLMLCKTKFKFVLAHSWQYIRKLIDSSNVFQQALE